MATSVDQLDDVTMITCCALPTLASCWTSNGAGGAGVAVFDGARVADGVACVVGVGFADEGVGVGAGGELTTFGVATCAVTGPALAGLAAPAGELAAADVCTG